MGLSQYFIGIARQSNKIPIHQKVTPIQYSCIVLGKKLKYLYSDTMYLVANTIQKYWAILYCIVLVAALFPVHLPARPLHWSVLKMMLSGIRSRHQIMKMIWFLLFRDLCDCTMSRRRWASPVAFRIVASKNTKAVELSNFPLPLTTRVHCRSLGECCGPKICDIVSRKA